MVTGELELIVAHLGLVSGDLARKKKKMGTRIYNHIVNFISYSLIQSLSPYQQV